MTSRLAKTLLAIAGLAPAFLGGIGSVGCGATSGDTVSSSTSGALTVIDPALAAVADVETDMVSFPSSAPGTTTDGLRERNAGDLLVSPRASAASQNPYGFLRTVTSRTEAGGKLSFGTQAAKLTDLIKEGSADAHFSIPNVDDALNFAANTLFTVDEDMGDFAAELKGIRLEANAQMNAGSVSFHPDLEVKTGFAGSKLTELKVVASGDFAANIDVQMQLKVDGTLGVDILNYLQTFRVLTWQKKLYTSPTWALPTQWIGSFPLEESVQMYVNAICSVRLNAFTGGELDAHAKTSVSASVQAGEAYENGSWSSLDSSTFSGSASLDLAQGASVDVTCQLAPSFALRFYDVAGPEIGVGPDVHFKVTTTGFDNADSKTSWQVDPGAQVWLKGDASFLGLSKSIGPYIIHDWTGSALVGGTLGVGDGDAGAANDSDAGAGDDGGPVLTGGDDDAGDGG